MSRRPAYRSFALFALALCLFGALPCAAAADPHACCGATAKCADAAESPCPQLAATPCCSASQRPLDARSAPKLPPLGDLAVLDVHRDAPCAVCVSPPRRVAPAALQAHATIRDVVLRL